MMIFPFSSLSLSPSFSFTNHSSFFAFSAYRIKKNASIHIDEGHWEKKERGDFSSAYLLLFHSLFFSVTIFLECIVASACQYTSHSSH